MILASHGIIGSQITQFVGLLDTYSGAAAAYSLRRLSGTYSGKAIRVRRTDLEELDIGFTDLGELDTAALLAFTGTGALDNGFVKTWYDQSGNAQNATQTTALNQPQIVSAGSVILENGKPTILFDGINHYLQAFTSDVRSTGYLELSVAKSITTEALSCLISHGSSISDVVAGYTATRNSGVDWGTFDGVQRIFGSVSGNQQIIQRYNLGTATQYNKVDNISGDSYTTTRPVRIGAIGILATSLPAYFDGNCQEVILWANLGTTSIELGVYNNVNLYY
jgi:hypothetical protein